MAAKKQVINFIILCLKFELDGEFVNALVGVCYLYIKFSSHIIVSFISMILFFSTAHTIQNIIFGFFTIRFSIQFTNLKVKH